MWKTLLILPLILFSASAFAEEDMLVCSLLSDQVLRYDGATGAYKGVFADTHIDGPEGITVGPDGNVYVASEYSGNITKWAPDGTFLSEFVPSMAGWEDLEFGPDGHLYAIAHFGLPSGPVSKFDGATGAYMGQWGGGAEVSHQHGLTFGPDGNPYLGRTIFGPVGSIGKIDQSTGVFAGSLATDPHLDGIFDLTFHGGFVYTSDHLTGGVHRFSATTGAYLGDFVPGGISTWGLKFRGDGFLYVSGGGVVGRFDEASGAFHDIFASGLSGATGFAFVTVPEPSAVILLLGGLVFALRKSRPGDT